MSSAASAPRPAALLPVAAFVSLLVLALGATGLFALHLTNLKNAEAAAHLEALARARLGAVETRAAFKTQVQEWKNILLRGHDAADLATYRGHFETEEARVRSGLQSLAERLPAELTIGDTSARDEITALLEEHIRLGATYRETLAGLDLAAPGAARRADAAVRGIDRELNDRLDALATAVELGAAEEIRLETVAADRRYLALRRATWIAAGLALLASLGLCFRASRQA